MDASAILAHIEKQIDAAGSELKAYQPATVDWHARCLTAARIVMPWLVEVAPSLREEVDLLFASPRSA